MNEDHDWTLDAACRGEQPEIFYPTYGPSRADRDQAANKALAFCHACPVQETCLNTALTEEQDDLAFGGPWGIRGGTTEQTRAQLIRAQRALQQLTKESA